MRRIQNPIIRIVSYFLMAFPFSYILAVMIVFDLPMRHLPDLIISPFFAAISFMGVCAGVGLRNLQPWAWGLYFFKTVLLIPYNAFVLNQYGETHHPFAAFTVTSLLVIAIAVLVYHELRVPYFLPRIRWWESDPRLKRSLPTLVSLSSGEKLEGEILDISASGCFIKMFKTIRENEKVIVEFNQGGLPLRCEGVVVWETESKVTHPKGIGVKFSIPRSSEGQGLREKIRKVRRDLLVSRNLSYENSFPGLFSKGSGAGQESRE